MTSVYYVLVLVNAAVCLAVAVAAYWRNRYRLVGPLFGIAMVFTAVWLVGFAQYFAPLRGTTAMWWAKFTLSAGILSTPFLFHSMCALVDKSGRVRWWLMAAYALGVAFVILLWQGHLVTGLRS